MSDDDKPTEPPIDLRDVKPTCFRQMIGNRHVTEALRIAVESSFAMKTRLDDVLLCGPSGTGKSSYGALLSQELGGIPLNEIFCTSISSVADLNGVLLSAGDGVLMLDELATLPHPQQHALLEVLDKRRISISGGKSSIPLGSFVLVGCTTDPDMVIGPLVQRFRIQLQLDFYSVDELALIVKQRCLALGWDFEPELLMEIAKRGCQTPRIAIRWLQSARRWQTAEGADRLTVDHLRKACQVERISDRGLDNNQQKYLRLLANGPLRLNVLASVLGVSAKLLQKTVEPYLLRSSMIEKTENGLRTLGDLGRTHLEEISNGPEMG